MQNSKMLILPSGKTLQRHKNKLPSLHTINDEALRWMNQSADAANIPPAGRRGGLMHDETKLQEDLVCIYKGSTMKLIGLVDTGEEAFQKSVV
jgi:hypothetical protein